MYLFTILVHSSILEEAVLFPFSFFSFFPEKYKKISNPQMTIKRLLTWLHWVQKDWLLSIAVEHKVKKRATIPMMVPLFECNLPREAMGVCMSVVRVDHTYF